MPAEQNRTPMVMALSAATDSTERSMWPAMMTRAKADRHHAQDRGRLDDVGEDAGLEEVGNEQEKTASTASSMNPPDCRARTRAGDASVDSCFPAVLNGAPASMTREREALLHRWI